MTHPCDKAKIAHIRAMIDALKRKARELNLENKAWQCKQKAVAELEELALSRYYDPELARLWMRKFAARIWRKITPGIHVR